MFNGEGKSVMKIEGAFNAGLAGWHQAVQRVDAASQAIAGAATGTTQDRVDTPRALVDLQVGSHQGQVAARVIQTAGELLGNLIDIRV